MSGELKGKLGLKSIVILQLIVIVYTFSPFFGKMARMYDFMSGMFILYFVLDFLVLAVYALLWQQALKRFDLHVAYANRAIAIVWGIVWAALFLKEEITVANIIGTVIIIAGMMLVNSNAD